MQVFLRPRERPQIVADVVDDNVDVRMAPILMQHEYVLVVVQLVSREAAGRLHDSHRRRALRHRKDDVNRDGASWSWGWRNEFDTRPLGFRFQRDQLPFTLDFLSPPFGDRKT